MLLHSRLTDLRLASQLFDLSFLKYHSVQSLWRGCFGDTASSSAEGLGLVEARLKGASIYYVFTILGIFNPLLHINKNTVLKVSKKCNFFNFSHLKYVSVNIVWIKRNQIFAFYDLPPPSPLKETT